MMMNYKSQSNIIANEAIITNNKWNIKRNAIIDNNLGKEKIEN